MSALRRSETFPQGRDCRLGPGISPRALTEPDLTLAPRRGWCCVRLIKKSRETTMKGPNVLRIVAALVAALAAMPANAQIYPDHPVKIVLPFGAGGVADISSRIIADKLGERLGQRFVIENMPGAGGI